MAGDVPATHPYGRRDTASRGWPARAGHDE